MQALILGDDHRQQARLAAAMMKAGFQVFCVESAAAAASYIRHELIDVLVLTETRSVRINQSCACVGQSRNRAVSVIVITDRTGPAIQELFEEVPQLYGVMGLQMAPAMVAALAVASILPQQVDAASQPNAQRRAIATDETSVGPSVVDPLAGPTDAPLSAPFVMAATAPLAKPATITMPVSGPGGSLVRTLIEPQRRPAPPAQMLGVPATAARDYLDPSILAQKSPVPTASPAPGTTYPAKITAIPPTLPAVPSQAPVWTGVSLSESADIGLDLAALERELELVNRDRPSVLAGSIADNLPDWAQPAPRLAALTDWALATPHSTDGPATVAPTSLATLAKPRIDRRLELGAKLQ